MGIRVVIIDDEPLMVRNLSRQLSKEDHDYQVIGTAFNGEEGLDVVAALMPDLIFVDISMPVMTGIEMIEALRLSNNQTPIVILSGYADFDKAKKALQLGVIDYLVKPLNPLKLKDFLGDIKLRLTQNKALATDDRFNKLLHYPSQIKASEKSDKVDYHMVKLCLGPYNFFRNSVIETTPVYIERDSICGELRSIIGNDHSISMIQGKYLNEFTIIYSKGYQSAEIISKQLYDRLKDGLEEQSYISLVYEMEGQSEASLRACLVSMESTLYHTSIFAKGILTSVETEGCLEERAEKANSMIRSMINPTNTRELDEMLQITARFFGYLSKVNCTQAELIMWMRKMLVALVSDNHTEIEDGLINSMIVTSSTYEALLEQLNLLLQEYFDEKIKKGKGNLSAEMAIKQVRSYIDYHYAESIRIQDLAERFGFNYSYLSIIFKKFMALSPNEYIISRRLEEAKFLLQETNQMTVKEIAQAVGYEDQYYFSRIFKANTGCTPTAFRRSATSN